MGVKYRVRPISIPGHVLKISIKLTIHAPLQINTKQKLNSTNHYLMFQLLSPLLTHQRIFSHLEHLDIHFVLVKLVIVRSLHNLQLPMTTNVLAPQSIPSVLVHVATIRSLPIHQPPKSCYNKHYLLISPYISVLL